MVIGDGMVMKFGNEQDCKALSGGLQTWGKDEGYKTKGGLGGHTEEKVCCLPLRWTVIFELTVNLRFTFFSRDFYRAMLIQRTRE